VGNKINKPNTRLEFVETEENSSQMSFTNVGKDETSKKWQEILDDRERRLQKLFEDKITELTNKLQKASISNKK